ncbi:hypothetical protein [Actinocorallia aurea]
MLDDGTGGHFGLHVSEDDFDRLEEITVDGLVLLAHSFLRTFRNIPLDQEQREAWEAGYSDGGLA